MAEHLVSQLPLKKRKISAQPLETLDQESPSVGPLSSTKLLLQIPPKSNTSLPVWECVNSAQAEVQWTVAPYGITIQITPKKAQSHDQPAAWSSPQAETQPSTLPVPAASLLGSSAMQRSKSVIVSPPGAAPLPFRIVPTHPLQTRTLGSTAPLPTPQLQPFPWNQAHSPPAPPDDDDVTGPSEDASELTDLLFQPKPKANWVLQARFHTQPSEEISICDPFLLGCCPNGFECELHHTPYPFHWQLRRRDTHQWVSTSHSAQVKLENLYCDKDRDDVRLQDVEGELTLQFDTMTVENSETYDKARRLSNSSNPERNPHFPTKWQMYWWNFGWEKYTNEVSMLLLKKMEARKRSCRFHIGEQGYKVDFSSMTQRNLTTGYKRGVRRRPTFRSLISLKSHLKTVVLRAKMFGQALRSFNVNPLREFSRWYPPVWITSPDQGSDQGFRLVEVPPNTKAYQSIYCLFHSTMSETETEIVSIQQVQNTFQWDKYRRQKEHMERRNPDQSRSLERHLFHGTTEESAKEICLNNFDPRVSGKNGVAYGRGSYFARDATYSNTYTRESGEENFRHMFLAKVLVGRKAVGRPDFRRPPRLCPWNSGYELYDTCVDRMRNPSIFVVFDTCQCYPYYLIKYRAVSDTVKIF